MRQISTSREPVASLEAALRKELGDENVLHDVGSRERYSADLLAAGATSELVVRPNSVAELQAAVTSITQAGFAVIPRGGGLTYVGGYTSQQLGFVAVDLRRMDRILEINTQDMYITVEAGATWKQIYEALKPLGMRLPFFGTFSGRNATVGGGLSNGALFLGTARYGSAADIVLGMDVVLADGSLLRTGQLAVARATKPFFRVFGPDTTGLFVHDAGALGIKAHATLRLIHDPAFTDYLSFGFQDRVHAIAALSEMGRGELAEDAYMMDPDKTRAALSAPADFVRDARTLLKVVGQENGFLRGLRAGAKLAVAGRDFVEDGCFSLHLVCAGRNRSSVEHDMADARAIAAKFDGKELPNSIPKAGRADLFAPLDTVVGPTGERWIAINAKIAHSDALLLVTEAEAIMDEYKERTDRHGIVTSRLFTVLSNHAFSYEIVLNWHDAWLPMHHDTMSDALKAKLQEPPAAPEARALVMQVREAIVALFARHGAASSQIGRAYPYASILRSESLSMLTGMKRLLDPLGLMNPGALEL